MSTRSTPGPWHCDYDRAHDRFNLRGTTSFGHFCGWSADGVTTEVEDHANARLIAAAPELLAALEAMLEPFGLGDTNWQVEQARAAIAKAIGNTTNQKEP